MMEKTIEFLGKIIIKLNKGIKDININRIQPLYKMEYNMIKIR